MSYVRTIGRGLDCGTPEARIRSAARLSEACIIFRGKPTTITRWARSMAACLPSGRGPAARARRVVGSDRGVG
eukprot:5628075-Pyramimonas_sp.AAC.1